MYTGNLFRIFACLKEQDDVAHANSCAFDNWFAAINGRITNDIGMGGTFNAHKSKLLPIAYIISVALKDPIRQHHTAAFVVTSRNDWAPETCSLCFYEHREKP